ncbi:MAG: FecR domain-containing protein [Firmicutes bacterium]|nr:FecR domain-containing protein [Bacillota bacterium]
MDNHSDKRLEAYIEALNARRKVESDPSMEERTQRMLSRLGARIDADEVSAARRRSMWRYAGMAAAVVLICGLAWLMRPSGVSPKEAVYENALAEVSRITLPDGSEVCLKRGGVIRYSELRNLRTASLCGEAYFDVARDTLRPFVVSTEAIDVKVLGTAFSVDAPEGSGKADIVLERGSVRLMSKGGTPLLRMSPNQKARINAATGDVSVEQVYAGPMIQQQYSIVSLDNACVEQILHAIESAYGVKINASGFDRSKQYHMSFLRNDPLGDVLAVLEALTGGRFSSTNAGV